MFNNKKNDQKKKQTFSDFGRDAQRVSQAERSLMSPLAGTKRAAQD